MKKNILIIFLMLSFTSCSLDNENASYNYNVLPVESYIVPSSFTLGEIYVIKLKYQKPTSCHLFQGIYYDKNLNTRTIAIQTVVKNSQACTQDIPPLSEVSFKFTATNTGTYIFKFYKGKDTKGEDVFEDVEIPAAQ